jgi:asparagine synthase (glutamine-hydrolysing)
MCGITGIWKFNDLVQTRELNRFNSTLEKRGPDTSDEVILNDGHLGLGHTRLSILDLSEQGNQPMKVEDYTIVFNGEIFNYIELRDELKKQGYTFRTETDTEVVVNAIDYWGKDAFNKFNGMWALALWSEKDQSLLLSRDRFGIKPLYYYKDDNYLAFSSQTVAFNALEYIDKSINEENLKIAWEMPYRIESLGKTIFNKVFGLLPGHFMELSVNDKSCNQKRWWFPDKETVDIKLPNYEKQVKEYRDLFVDSCNLRLRSDVPIASALSGGIDSSAVYSTVKHLAKTKHQDLPASYQKCFIGSFPNTEQDETEYALEAAAFVNGETEIVETDFDNLLDDIEDITVWFDSISSLPLLGISHVYGRMREKGYKISMDGHGPDELFYGYHGMMSELTEHAIWNLPSSFAKSSIDAFAGRYENPGLKRAELLSELSKSDSGIKGQLYKQRNKSNLKSKLAETEIYSPGALSQHEYDFSNIPQPQRTTFQNFYVESLPGILKTIDHASMFYSVEVRSPFLDYRLVNYASALPVTSKVGGGFNKRIIRDSMEGIMAPATRNRKSKKGFGSPILSWVQQSSLFNDFIGDHLNSQAFKELPLDKININKNLKELDYSSLVEIWKRINLSLIQNKQALKYDGIK